MRIIAVLILIFGATLAGGAVFFATEKFNEERAMLARLAAEAAKGNNQNQVKTVSVVVAAKSLRYGQVVEEDQLKIVQFPEESAPKNAYASIEEVIGDGRDKRSVLRSVEPDEPVLKSKLTAFGERATISAQLKPGMRAFTIKIDTVSGVAGFLLPNDRVDIFLTRGSNDGISTDLILQNVKVIAVDQFSDKESNQARVARTATVEVEPDDAQRLALAQQIGKISLTLRQIDEITTTEAVGPIKIGDVINAAPVEEAPEVKRLCVRRGTELVCEE